MFDCDDNHQYTHCVHTDVTVCKRFGRGTHVALRKRSVSGVGGWTQPGLFDLEERVDVAVDLQEAAVS